MFEHLRRDPLNTTRVCALNTVWFRPEHRPTNYNTQWRLNNFGTQPLATHKQRCVWLKSGSGWNGAHNITITTTILIIITNVSVEQLGCNGLVPARTAPTQCIIKILFRVQQLRRETLTRTSVCVHSCSG